MFRVQPQRSSGKLTQFVVASMTTYAYIAGPGDGDRTGHPRGQVAMFVAILPAIAAGVSIRSG